MAMSRLLLMRAPARCARGHPRLRQKWALQPAQPWQTWQAQVSRSSTCRFFCSDDAALPQEQQVPKLLLQHPSVEQCEVVEGIAYVVRSKSTGSFLAGPVTVDEWELKEYLMAKMADVQGYRGPSCGVTKVRFADRLPGETARHVPFTFLHILDALFTDAAAAGNDDMSFQAFQSFCDRTKRFEGDAAAASDYFYSACMTSLSGADVFQDPLLPSDTTQGGFGFYHFQKFILESGLVEVTTHAGRVGLASGVAAPTITYFIDENVVDVVLKKWLAMYDGGTDGTIAFGEYVNLVKDYNLHYAISETAFQRVAEDGVLTLAGFRNLLLQSGLLETGASVTIDDEVGRVWRSIEDKQQFLPPKRVFVADGREGTSPARAPDSLRFVCISDTHGHHRELTEKLPPGDVLLHGGDFSMGGELEEIVDFARWVQELPYERKVVIAGNHDLSFDRTYEGEHSRSKTDAGDVRSAFSTACGDDGSVVYLEDEEYLYRGIRFYGTPWQPEFGYWAFNLPRGKPLSEKWKAVPAGIDILLVHGPPLGRGDACLPSNKRMGCADLLTEIQERIRPAYTISGHIHEGAGVTFDGTTHFLNACSLNENYECVHAPLVFDMPLPKQ